MNIDIDRIAFDKMNGIIPAIIQDNRTMRVLMQGYMNREYRSRSNKSCRRIYPSYDRLPATYELPYDIRDRARQSITADWIGRNNNSGNRFPPGWF